MVTRREIVEAIDQRRQTLKQKKADLARAAGLKPANVRTLFSKSKPNPDLATLYRLMTPLGLRWECTDADCGRDFVAFLDTRREERGLTLKQLAELAGVDSSNLKKLFASETPRPRLKTLLELADALEISMRLVPRHETPEAPQHDEDGAGAAQPEPEPDTAPRNEEREAPKGHHRPGSDRAEAQDEHAASPPQHEAASPPPNISPEDYRRFMKWFEREFPEALAQFRREQAEKRRRARELDDWMRQMFGLPRRAPSPESEREAGDEPRDTTGDQTSDKPTEEESAPADAEETKDDKDSRKSVDDEEFQGRRKKWPNDRRWNDKQNAGDESKPDPGGGESDTTDPPEPEAVEWDVILDEEPPDPKNAPNTRWYVTPGGALVLVLVFGATALSGVAVMRKVRTPAIMRSVPLHRDPWFWFNIGASALTLIASRFSSNEKVRQIGTVASAGYLTGTLVGGLYRERQRRVGPKEPPDNDDS